MGIGDIAQMLMWVVVNFMEINISEGTCDAVKSSRKLYIFLDCYAG